MRLGSTPGGPGGGGENHLGAGLFTCTHSGVTFPEPGIASSAGDVATAHALVVDPIYVDAIMVTM
jgi:hypothetical protein